VLVLNLQKDSLVQIGGEQLEIIVIYNSCVYVKYKDETHRITHKLQTLDSSLELVFKRRENLYVRMGLNSPFDIRRL